MTMMQIRDVSLYVEVVGHGSATAAHAWRARARPRLAHTVPTTRRPAHRRLLRPPLQRAVDRRTGDVDDLGEPHRGRRRAPGGARVRAVGRARAFVRRPRRPRVRAPLPGRACRSSSCSTRQATRDGRRRTRPRSSPAAGSARRRWPSLAASTTGGSPRRTSSAPRSGSLPAYDHRFSLLRLAREMLEGGWRAKARPEALKFGGQMMRGWSVMDRLGEIHAPTFVIAGHDDFLFPPESQALLAAGSRTLGCTSSSGPATTRSPSDRPRRWRRSRISLPWRHCRGRASPRTRPSCRRRRHEPDHGRCRHHARETARVREVYVHESGSPAAPTVVFVHGGGPSERCGATTWTGWRVSFTAWRPTSPVSGAATSWRPFR